MAMQSLPGGVVELALEVFIETSGIDAQVFAAALGLQLATGTAEGSVHGWVPEQHWDNARDIFGINCDLIAMLVADQLGVESKMST